MSIHTRLVEVQNVLLNFHLDLFRFFHVIWSVWHVALQKTFKLVPPFLSNVVNKLSEACDIIISFMSPSLMSPLFNLSVHCCFFPELLLAKIQTFCLPLKEKGGKQIREVCFPTISTVAATAGYFLALSISLNNNSYCLLLCRPTSGHLLPIRASWSCALFCVKSRCLCYDSAAPQPSYDAGKLHCPAEDVEQF